jgi:hypothetical protein
MGALWGNDDEGAGASRGTEGGSFAWEEATVIAGWVEALAEADAWRVGTRRMRAGECTAGELSDSGVGVAADICSWSGCISPTTPAADARAMMASATVR